MAARQDAEFAIAALEIEDEREKAAIRAFHRREADDRLLRKGWRWLKDRYLWLRWFSWN